jgi:acyl-CoA thioesterase I
MVKFIMLISVLLLNDQKKRIVFFGDSLTAAYGLSKKDGYPGLIQNKIDSLKLNYSVVNAGLTGETTAGGLRRINWLLSKPVDIFVLALGGNDALRGISTESTKSNLNKIISIVQEKNPSVKIVLTGMKAPPNMGKSYALEFEEIYTDLAKKHSIPFVPFLLKDVGGISNLNLADGIHPNQDGHKIISETIWKILKDLL